MRFVRAAVALLVVALAATVVSAAATVVIDIGGVSAVSAVSVVAANHGSAPGANYTVGLAHPTDHYPGTRGGRANATHYWTAPGGYERHQIEDGFENVSYLQFRSGAVDFSECTTDNTVRFGVDRDDDDPGTQIDLNLDRYTESIQFSEQGIVVDFYDGDEFRRPFETNRGGRQAGRSDGDGNLELYPDDQIVLQQGTPAGGGPCYVMPDERGWYQMDSGVNGTAFDGRFVGINDVLSHYFYVCVCDSRQSARATLGPPPSGPGTGTRTATPPGTGTTTPTGPGQGTPNGTVGPTPTPTDPGRTTSPTETAARDGGDGGTGGNGGDSGELTPAFTPGFAPGFGVVVALVALVVGALLGIRRLEY